MPNTITQLDQELYNSFVYKVPIGRESKKTVKQRKKPKIDTPKSLQRVRNPSSCVTSLGTFVIQKLKSIFPDGGTVFVIDGDRTSAKSETSMKRHREWGKVVDELDKVAASMKQAADDGKKRMPKSFYEKVDRLTRRSFLVNEDVKTDLAAALEAEFKVEKASGRVATDLDIVVSGDSDVFCYRNVNATRHRGQYVFNVLDKSLALRKMRLNADDLVVLAVVSGNDYASNISGKAIVTNVKIFQKIKEKGDFSKEEMLKKQSPRSKGLEKRDKSLALISAARAALVAIRGNRGNECLFKAHWSPNPFRPLQSKDEIPRHTPSTIDRITPMKGPVPPVLKVSPKVVEFDSDKYKEVKEVPKAKADEDGTSRGGPSKSRKTR
ncbi:hypothetical protein SeLEV6574_g06024 [Synchytrium endobioticum]|uniref:XPG-I domain-containing protein n=1 Tax=Synchytrium endobioticum TaxID=286115 RepID=A0A507CR03_9FUNG|nr:hypothetical protein SeLEV6574_g06024 [Synchytrium endobioticum]